MRAAILRGVRKVALEELPVPTFGDGDVLVAIRSAAICGSDLHGFEGLIPQRRPVGIAMGHECAGVVEEVGRKVTRVKKGDRVAVDPQITCGVCYACRQRWRSLCDDCQVLGSAMRVFRHGANTEFVAVPGENVYKLPDSVSFAEAAMGEPVGNAVHLIRRVGVTKGSHVVVIGAGTMGLIVAQVAKSYGAGTLTVIEPLDFKRNLARRLCADVALNPKQDDVEGIVKKNTGGLGADIVLECCGVSATYQLAVRLAGKRGVIGALGYIDEEVSFPMRSIIFNEKSIVGSTGFYWPDDPALEMIADGRVDVKALITHRFPFNQAQKAYETAGTPEAIKVVIDL